MKKKTPEQIKFDEELGKKLSKIMEKQNISGNDLAKKIDVTRAVVDGYKYGTYSLSAYKIYQLINILKLSLSDLTSFFNFTEQKVNTSSSLSQLDEKINILKQIYESGDKVLIGSIDYCLKGAFDDFLKKQKKEIA